MPRTFLSRVFSKKSSHENKDSLRNSSKVSKEREKKSSTSPSLKSSSTTTTSTTNLFPELGLRDFVVKGAKYAGYSQPTPIQQQAIPIVLTGKDLIGSAQTGTGKTAAFALPIIDRIEKHGKCRVLVLVPTRELAMQVGEAFISYAKFTDLRTAILYGGVGYGKQRQELADGVDILVCTPGRLIDYLNKKTVSLSDIECLVLDEVDRMLDMGFLPDVKRLIEKCPKQRQTLFFSATLPPEIAKLTTWALRHPKIIETAQRSSPAETVKHAFYPVNTAQKFDLLLALLKKDKFQSVLIFTRTKHGADRIAKKLKVINHKVAVLHSNRTQNQRVQALDGFKSGRYEVLVATDIAARGIDVAGVTHVINYDVPKHAEDYVHRIGRTGRAQQTGDAFTIITPEDNAAARNIERYIGAKIPRERVEGFSYKTRTEESQLESIIKSEKQEMRRPPRRSFGRSKKY